MRRGDGSEERRERREETMATMKACPFWYLLEQQVPGQYSMRGRHDGAWPGTARLSGLMWMDGSGWMAE